jgi:hypothetical protein
MPGVDGGTDSFEADHQISGPSLPPSLRRFTSTRSKRSSKSAYFHPSPSPHSHSPSPDFRHRPSLPNSRYSASSHRSPERERAHERRREDAGAGTGARSLTPRSIQRSLRSIRRELAKRVQRSESREDEFTELGSDAENANEGEDGPGRVAVSRSGSTSTPNAYAKVRGLNSGSEGVRHDHQTGGVRPGHRGGLQAARSSLNCGSVKARTERLDIEEAKRKSWVIVFPLTHTDAELSPGAEAGERGGRPPRTPEKDVWCGGCYSHGGSSSRADPGRDHSHVRSRSLGESGTGGLLSCTSAKDHTTDSVPGVIQEGMMVTPATATQTETRYQPQSPHLGHRSPHRELHRGHRQSVISYLSTGRWSGSETRRKQRRWVWWVLGAGMVGMVLVVGVVLGLVLGRRKAE